MPSRPAGFAFPRGSRLRQSREFSRLKETGQRIIVGCIIANWGAAPGERSRLGVVTHRGLGSAVARNRARRLLREVYRLHQHQLRIPVDLILVARKSIVSKPFAGVEEDVLRALRRGGLLSA